MMIYIWRKGGTVNAFRNNTISGINLTGPGFLKRKDRIIGALEHEIKHGDMDRLAAYRRNKRTL